MVRRRKVGSMEKLALPLIPRLLALRNMSSQLLDSKLQNRRNYILTELSSSLSVSEM